MRRRRRVMVGMITIRQKGKIAKAKHGTRSHDCVSRLLFLVLLPLAPTAHSFRSWRPAWFCILICTVVWQALTVALVYVTKEMRCSVTTAMTLRSCVETSIPAGPSYLVPCCTVSQRAWRNQGEQIDSWAEIVLRQHSGFVDII